MPETADGAKVVMGGMARAMAAEEEDWLAWEVTASGMESKPFQGRQNVAVEKPAAYRVHPKQSARM